jgi:hypothetical protein
MNVICILKPVMVVMVLSLDGEKLITPKAVREVVMVVMVVILF